MKKLTLIVLTLVLFIACKKEKKEVAQNAETESQDIAPVTPEMMETAVIYEANIRQYSPEGTFEEFTKDIPQLKQLGVKVIWLMPVFPISETKRKATGGPDSKFATDFPEEEQKKYLGSYYAVTDFTKINPEYGTIEDFRKLLKTAHENDIYVILDWVPNHTGWDHIWIKNKPDYYTKDKDGNITHPEGTDWTDVADLNYDNKAMRKEMIEDMMYWITDEGVDGFRCDVAGSVPLDFWKECVSELRAKKPLFMLAEAWEPELLKGNLFDMAYAWEGHHILNKIAQGEQGVKEWDAYIEKMGKEYEQDDILMNFITNHDENSWNGTINERMGNAAETMLALSYVAPGMPLIYSGQEYDLNHRLKFFEKDSIPKTKGKMWPLLEKLGKLKTDNVALNGGKSAADYKRLSSENKDVLVFERNKKGTKVTFIANLTDKEQKTTVTILGNFTDYMNNTKVEFKEGETITLKPWEYKILIN